MIKKLENILFIDIETVSTANSLDNIEERLKTQWARKAGYLKQKEPLSDQELFFNNAGIYAEFGKVITIGLGYFHKNGNEICLRTKILYNHDEKTLLEQFKKITTLKRAGELKLCAHNGREFDFPYLSRRMLINGIDLPPLLNLSGKKPWEINHIDTMDMWKFGDWKHYTSLELLATIFDIASSKSDISGDEVNKVYYHDNDLEKIAEYCLKDVVVTAKLYLKLKNITLENLEVITIPPN